jgi:cell division protein FtsA
LAKNEISAGLDIGTSKVATTVAEVGRDGHIEVLGAAAVPCAGLKKGIVVDMDATISAISQSVERAASVAGAEIAAVIVNITGEHISSLNSRAVVSIKREDHEITQDDVNRVLEESKRIVLPPEREIVHAIPRSFAIDGQDGIHDPAGMNGGRLEVETHIVTGSSTFLQNVSKCVQRAGMEIEERVHQPLATGYSVILPAEKERGAALVDIGGWTTDVAIYTDGEVTYSTLVPVGSNHVTQDIAMGLRASTEEAERVKLAFGCAMMDMVPEDDMFSIMALGATEPATLPRRQVLAHIIEARYEEILSMVKQAILKSERQELLRAGVILTGGGSLLPGVTELAERTLALRIRTGSVAEVTGLAEQVNSPVYATSLGLILYQARKRVMEQDESGKKGLIKNIGGKLRDIFG